MNTWLTGISNGLALAALRSHEPCVSHLLAFTVFALPAADVEIHGSSLAPTLAFQDCRGDLLQQLSLVWHLDQKRQERITSLHSGCGFYREFLHELSIILFTSLERPVIVDPSKRIRRCWSGPAEPTWKWRCSNDHGQAFSGRESRGASNTHEKALCKTLSFSPNVNNITCRSHLNISDYT